MNLFFSQGIVALFGAGIFFGLISHWAGSSLIGDFAYVLGIGALFLSALRVLNRAANHFSFPARSVIHWTHALVFEAIAVPAALFFRLMRLISPKNETLGSKQEGRPVLLIHGYLHDRSAWVFHKRKLAEKGFGPIYLLDFGYPFHSIVDYAEKVKKLAEKIENQTGRNDLIIIGHSMGGLVASWYATQMAPSGKKIDVITLGSPLKGTILARIAIGKDAREMEIGSNLLKKLEEHVENSKKIGFFHIAAKTDQIVIPSKSAILGNRLDRQFVLNDIGHLTLLYSPRVSDKIAAWLQTLC